MYEKDSDKFIQYLKEFEIEGINTNKSFLILVLQNNTFKEASKLLKKDKEKIVNELSKLLKVADGDQKILKNTVNKIETKLKIKV